MISYVYLLIRMDCKGKVKLILYTAVKPYEAVEVSLHLYPVFM